MKTFPTIANILATENYNRILRESIYDQEDDDVDSISYGHPDAVTIVKEDDKNWDETDAIAPNKLQRLNADDEIDDDPAPPDDTSWPATVPSTAPGKVKNSATADRPHEQNAAPVAVFVDKSLDTPDKKNRPTLSKEFVAAAGEAHRTQGPEYARLVQRTLPPGEIGKQLGQGVFGKVFLFRPDNGPDMALKVPYTWHVDKIKPYKLIANVYEQLPKEIAKHFPKIYGIWVLKRRDGAFPLILSELLEELPGVRPKDDVPRIAKPWMPVKADKKYGLFADEDYIFYALQDDIKVAILLRALYSQYKLSKSVARKFAAAMQREAPVQRSDSKWIHGQKEANFEKWLDDTLQIGIKYKILPGDAEIVGTGRLDAADILERAGAHFSRHFPLANGTAAQQAALALQRQGVKNTGLTGMVNALHYMYNNYNMRWVDLHFGNVLVRKKGGDLVVNDVGLFNA